jgi:UDP-galactopyranose mutase
MRRALDTAAARDGWDAVIFNDPRWGRLASRLPAKMRIFDCMDDLTATAPSAEWAARMEQQALQAANRVWTGTASLADRLHGAHPCVRFVPCGVDVERFAAPAPAAIQAARRDLPPGDGPLAGYFGVLNERVDMRRIEALLESGPWRVLLIGPATSRAPQLPSTPRLRYLGPRPYAELPGYLAHFDLALIPYDTTGPHRFLYPVKALEYLAAAKPVLTTPLPDVVRFLGDFVELADAPADWAAAGRRLMNAEELAMAQTRAARGQAYARSRSWDAMVDEMEGDLRAE